MIKRKCVAYIDGWLLEDYPSKVIELYKLHELTLVNHVEPATEDPINGKRNYVTHKWSWCNDQWKWKLESTVGE